MNILRLLVVLLTTTQIAVGMELVDDALYRNLEKIAEARKQGSVAADFDLANVYSRARHYAKAESIYRKYEKVADRCPTIYSNLSVCLGKQGKYQEAIRYADLAMAFPDSALHATLVKASWLYESGKKDDALLLFASVPVPAAGDQHESTFWGCSACFNASAGDEDRLQASIMRCLELGEEHHITFFKRDVVFDQYRKMPWFVKLIGITVAE